MIPSQWLSFECSCCKLINTFIKIILVEVIGLLLAALNNREDITPLILHNHFQRDSDSLIRIVKAASDIFTFIKVGELSRTLLTERLSN